VSKKTCWQKMIRKENGGGEEGDDEREGEAEQQE
jgi:hypothetical protein